MMTEELEFQISQYADGSLPADVAARVATLVETDPSAARTLRQYRALGRHLSALPGPGHIDYAALSAGINRELDRPIVAGRIFPARAVGSALAAVLLLAVGVRLWWPKPAAPTPVVTVDRIQTVASAEQVVGPQLPVATSQAVVEVSIGPSPAVAAESRFGQSQVVVASRPGSATIASAVRRGDRNPKMR